MLPFGHLGASYLLTKISRKLSALEILLILFGAIAPDLDLPISFWLQKSHHDLITHTPLGILLIWLVLALIFRKKLSTPGRVLLFLSLLTHLLLDEVGYWFYLLGFQSISNQPQINWFYPLTAFPIRTEVIFFPSFLIEYLTKAPANVLAEIILTILAGAVFLRQLFKKHEKRN